MDPQNMQNMRSPLARAIGLGSAKEGVGPWWAERVSAVALVPLTLWFAASIIAHTGSDYATFIVWLKTPLTAILMILLLIALFYHTALGLQVVIEDYVHSATKFAAVIAVRLGCCALVDRRCRGHPAYRAQWLRETMRALRKPCNDAGAAHPAAMDRKDACAIRMKNKLGDNAMYVERLLPAAREKLVTITDDAPLTEAANFLHKGTDP